MSWDFHLRAVKQADMPAITDILCRYNLCSEDLPEHLADGFVVAEHGAAVVGVCGVEVHGPHGLLRSLAVSPEWQGRSAGRALVEDRIDWARRAGLAALYLLTIDADRYLARFGFRRLAREDVPLEIAKSYEFSSHCPESAIVMVKPLVDRSGPWPTCP